MAAERYSKEQVSYTDYGKEDRCELCVHYVNPTTCEIVVGRIRPEGWCEKFERAAA